MEDDLKKNKKNGRRPQKKIKNGRRPKFVFEKLEWRPQKNERWPQKK